jgi:LysM repeat protein
MSVLGFNPALEMSQLRSQRTLAMQASAPVEPAAAASTGSVNAAAAGATGDAAAGAIAVQEPPSTAKIVLGSVLRGAMSGASVTLGVKSAVPLLGKIGFLSNIVGKLPAAGAAGAGALGLLARVPLLGAALGKVLPMMGRTGWQGFAITGLIGAAVGAVVGGIKGLKTARAESAKYAEAMAAAQQQAEEAAKAEAQEASQQARQRAGETARTKRRGRASGGQHRNDWVISRTGVARKGATGIYQVKSGDTIAALAKRFYTTEAEIRRLNPTLGSTLPEGFKLHLRQQVIPNAPAWKSA